MPASNKTNKSRHGTLISPNKSQVTQDFEESSNSSSQNTSDNPRFRAQQDSKNKSYLALMITVYFGIQITLQVIDQSI